MIGSLVVDPPRGRFYSRGMVQSAPDRMDNNRIEALHGKVDALIALCGELREENQLLKANEQKLRSERRQLLEKNREAKQRLQAILMRLKALENA